LNHAIERLLHTNTLNYLYKIPVFYAMIVYLYHKMLLKLKLFKV
jgi:hypothetical protein